MKLECTSHKTEKFVKVFFLKISSKFYVWVEYLETGQEYDLKEFDWNQEETAKHYAERLAGLIK